MDKETFVARTVNRLIENHMPPGYEKAKMKIEERFEAPNSLERAAWQLYEYSEQDRPEIAKKIRTAAIEEAATVGEVEFGLLAPDTENYEIEKTFRARDEQRVLDMAIKWAEGEGYDVEEPSGGAESIFDWRFDGRKLTQIN